MNDRDNITGDGINRAARIMDCGDAGHILLSDRSAEDLLTFHVWQPHIHDLGYCVVKHGVRLCLYNFYRGSIGNPLSPSIISIKEARQAEALERIEIAPLLSKQPSSPVALLNLRIALLYKRNAQPDDYVLAMLENELKAYGCAVFIDRHLAVGVEWAQEIERQVATADAVIPLLSQAALHSEMLEYELQTAHRAGQEHGGKPRLLPVRLGYSGPLPPVLAAMLDPLQYVLWQSAADDSLLVAELVRSLAAPPPASVPLESVGGAVPLDSAFYIARPADSDFTSAITRKDSIVLVKGARQMGKTSLLARGLQEARQNSANVVLTDFQSFEGAELQTAPAFYRALMRSLKRGLKLEVAINSVWDDDLTPGMNLEDFLCDHVLPTVPTSLVWGLDEVDRLFACPFGTDVFALFRSWHNRRATEPDGPWKRLTLAIAYATEAHLFITDVNQSPFNVGTRLTLEDFTVAQVTELNRLYGTPLRSEDEIRRFFLLVNGQPYLVRRGLDAMAAQRLSFPAFEAQADTDEGLYGDHLRRILVLLSQDNPLLDVVRAILRGQPALDEESFYRLRSAGVMQGDSPKSVRPRCRLYETYLTRHLL